MGIVEKYEIMPFTRYRQRVTEFVEEGTRKHHTPLLCEIDITKARQYIRNYRQKTGEGLSNTSWIMKCTSQAVTEHKQVQAYRHGNSKLIIFDDVDIWLAIEDTVDGEKRVSSIIVRKANEKSVKDIHDEIRHAQVEQAEQAEDSSPINKNGITARRNALNKPWPKFLRKFFWRKLRKDAFFMKKVMGTVLVTTPSMSTKSAQWSSPPGIHSLIVNVGRIAQKPGVIDGKIEIREYLHLTISTDHDVVDGAPANRFIERLIELMESAYGLVD